MVQFSLLRDKIITENSSIFKKILTKKKVSGQCQTVSKVWSEDDEWQQQV
jgi:hypothetical protein